MKAQDMAPVASPAMVASCLQRGKKKRHVSKNTSNLEGIVSDLRCLGIFAAGPHDHIRWGSLRLSRSLIRLIARCSLLEKAHGRIGDPAYIATSVSRNNAEQALTGFFGEVRLFEDALGGIDVWKVERGAGMAGVEDCG